MARSALGFILAEAAIKEPLNPIYRVQAQQGFTAGDLVIPFDALSGRGFVVLWLGFHIFGKQRVH